MIHQKNTSNKEQQCLNDSQPLYQKAMNPRCFNTSEDLHFQFQCPVLESSSFNTLQLFNWKMLNHEIKWSFSVLLSHHFTTHPLHTKYTVETYRRGFGSIPKGLQHRNKNWDKISGHLFKSGG